MLDRNKHLTWCKRRALEYVDQGDLASAVASMSSDLSKHPETPQPTRFASTRHLARHAARRIRSTSLDRRLQLTPVEA
jgi:hypothetical protein